MMAESSKSDLTCIKSLEFLKHGFFNVFHVGLGNRPLATDYRIFQNRVFDALKLSSIG